MKKILFTVTAIAISFYSLFAQTQTTKLKVGDKAPDFTLSDALGETYKLSSYIGKSPVIVYFYPKANTSGCTIQACGIRDDWNSFKENNILVFGISVDGIEAIKKFVDDYKLNFPLLSDANKKVSKQYDVLNTNGMDKRMTFIVNKEGKIAEIISVTDVKGHSQEVLKKTLALK